MEWERFRFLRDNRVPARAGNLATCFVASCVTWKWEDWGKLTDIGGQRKDDVIHRDEQCIVLEERLSSRATNPFEIVRIIYARGVGWVRADSLTADISL